MKNLKSALIFMVPMATFAQAPQRGAFPVLLETGNFFICIIAGVLLALAFQLLLTVISVAGGISAVGNIKKKGTTDHHKKQNDDDSMNIGQKISTGFGVWTMITTSIALFFASLLAVQLRIIGPNYIGVALGLIIWASFFIVITYLEISAISSTVGGLVSTVKSGFGTASSAVSSAFSTSETDVAKTSAKEQAKQMRKEFQKLFDTNDIDKKVEDYVQQLKPQKIDVNNLKKQIKDLFTDLQVTEKYDADHHSVKKMILEETDNSALSKEDKQVIKDHIGGLKDIAKSDSSNQEKVKKGIEELTPADRDQINKYQDKIKKALQNTHKSELQPEKLEEDLKKIMNEPGQASNILKAKATALDRQSIIKIAASQGMKESEAEKYADKIEGVLGKITSFFGSAGNKVSSEKEGIQSKIKNMFSNDGDNGSSLNIDNIFSDFTSIFQSSGNDTGADLKYKLQHYNKEETATLIAKKTGMSRTESESIAETIVSARDSVLEKANQVEEKVNEKMHEVKNKSLEAAEESRKAAATAAWWLAGTAIISAIASAIGGMLALQGWFL